MRRSWWLFTLVVACGTDKAVPVDATLALDDAFGTGIDAPPDAPPPKTTVTCTGVVTTGTRMGADKFGGAIMQGTQVGLLLGYDPSLADEAADPKLFDHAMIGAMQADLLFKIPGNGSPMWTYDTDPTTNCRLTIVNDNPGDSFEFRCIEMTASPAVTGETVHSVTLTFTDDTGMLVSSAAPPTDALDLSSLDPAERTFVVEGQTYTWSGTIDSCL